jgi:uncharacterized membrane protein YhaH (DUF805 family)
MSWGEIFFGFRGRINRKIYWLGSVAVAIAGLLFIALLAYLATGNPTAPEVWQRPADKSGVWVPVWAAYFLFLAWPASALAVKRLHDRDRPAWLWYVYYAITAAISFLSVRGAADAQADPAASAATFALLLFGAYVIFELCILRGTTGQNQHGADPMPPGYYGGDYSIMSWMLALEGRISTRKWWLGVLINGGTVLAVSLMLAFSVSAFLRGHPGLEQNLSNPEWANSWEAWPILIKLQLRVMLPALRTSLSLWSLIALSVKRLHDRGLSGWLILVVLLPLFVASLAPSLAQIFELGENFVLLTYIFLLASAIWSVLQFGIFKGETGLNRHGPDPLARRS